MELLVPGRDIPLLVLRRIYCAATWEPRNYERVDNNLTGWAAGIIMDAIGRRRWAIAEGYIPSESSFSDRALIAHETACILNATDRAAHVTITIFFADREPAGPYRLSVPARRTL